jgi:hypothetical protein
VVSYNIGRRANTHRLYELSYDANTATARVHMQCVHDAYVQNDSVYIPAQVCVMIADQALRALPGRCQVLLVLLLLPPV